jgi:hypothetical protein|tara:strand:+ start:42 stop:578 length:537 start_codon:yes stop_codon:yes gene_type:complete
MKTYSQIGQDIFVLEQTNNKKNGTFVDIGGGHPSHLNNTFILEKEYLWTGISLDIGPPHAHLCYEMTKESYVDFWGSKRSTPIVVSDALETDFSLLFKEHSLPTYIDYLSIDLEPPLVTYEALKRVPFDEYKFKVITFETDFYREKSTQDPSRELLKSHGYKLVASIKNQEDWYIRED